MRWMLKAASPRNTFLARILNIGIIFSMLSSPCGLFASSYAQPEIVSHSIEDGEVVFILRNPFPRIAFTSFMLGAKCGPNNETLRLALIGTDGERGIAKELAVPFVQITGPILPDTSTSVGVPRDIAQKTGCTEYGILGARAQASTDTDKE